MAMLTATEPRAKKLTYKGLWSTYFTLKDRGYTYYGYTYLLQLYLLLGILTTGSTDYAAILTMAILTMAILIVALLTTSPGRAHNFKNERPYLLLWLYFTYLAAKSVPGFILRLKALI